MILSFKRTDFFTLWHKERCVSLLLTHCDVAWCIVDSEYSLSIGIPHSIIVLSYKWLTGLVLRTRFKIQRSMLDQVYPDKDHVLPTDSCLNFVIWFLQSFSPKIYSDVQHLNLKFNIWLRLYTTLSCHGALCVRYIDQSIFKVIWNL